MNSPIMDGLCNMMMVLQGHRTPLAEMGRIRRLQVLIDHAAKCAARLNPSLWQEAVRLDLRSGELPNLRRVVTSRHQAAQRARVNLPKRAVN